MFFLRLKIHWRFTHKQKHRMPLQKLLILFFNYAYTQFSEKNNILLKRSNSYAFHVSHIFVFIDCAGNSYA